jgi:uncharacterized protein with HEPN domain
MDNPTPKERAEHILEAIKLIKEFVSGYDEITFLNDVIIQSAVQYQFLIIGEAIRYIDNGILAKYNYPWHIPRSFRNFIIHIYHGVKMERIYYATQDLGELEKQVRLILKNEFS